jgi:phage baseplate assembly protein V
MLKFGIITDYKKGFARVHFTDLEIVTDFLPILVKHSLNDKDSYPVEINEHVAVLMDSNMIDGVILGSIPSDVDKPDENEGPGIFRKLFQDGSLIEFNRQTGNLKAFVKGNIQAKAEGEIIAETGQNATIKAVGSIDAQAGTKATVLAPNIELTGVVKIMGACNVTGAFTASSIATTGGGSIKAPGATIEADNIEASNDVKAGVISLKLHKHTGVQSGPAFTGLAQ